MKYWLAVIFIVGLSVASQSGYASEEGTCPHIAGRIRAALLDAEYKAEEELENKLYSDHKRISSAKKPGETPEEQQARRRESFEKDYQPKVDASREARKKIRDQQVEIFNDYFKARKPRGLKIDVRNYDTARTLYEGAIDGEPKYERLLNELGKASLEEQTRFFDKVESLNALNRSYHPGMRWRENVPRKFIYEVQKSRENFQTQILEEVADALSDPKATFDTAFEGVEKQITLGKGPPKDPAQALLEPKRRRIRLAPKNDLRLTQKETDLSSRNEWAYDQARIFQQEFIDSEKAILTEREKAFETLKKTPSAPPEELADAKEQLVLAQQRYLGFLINLKNYKSDIAPPVPADAINKELSTLTEKILKDQGVKFKKPIRLFRNIFGETKALPTYEIAPNDTTPLNRFAKAMKVKLVIEPESADGGHFDPSTNTMTVGAGILQGIKNSVAAFHELLHKRYSELYDEGVDSPFHGRTRVVSDTDNISHNFHPEGYSEDASHEEADTFALNLNMLRNTGDYHRALAYSRTGGEITGQFLEATQTLRAALDEASPKLSNGFVAKPLSEGMFAGSNGKISAVVQVKLSDKVAVGFKIDETHSGKKILNVVVQNDRIVQQLPLMDDGALEIYQKLMKKGGITMDGGLLKQLVTFTRDRMSRFEPVAKARQDDFQAVRSAAAQAQEDPSPANIANLNKQLDRKGFDSVNEQEAVRAWRRDP